MKFIYTKQNIIRGAVIYSLGDTIASLIINKFSIIRLLGMMFIGGTYYAFEIPNVFKWIENKFQVQEDALSALMKTTLALSYFNPFWITRHLFYLKFFSGNWAEINFNLFYLGTKSFLLNIPITFTANYLIQNKVELNWRFYISAVFSSLMAVYYALTEVIIL